MRSLVEFDLFRSRTSQRVHANTRRAEKDPARFSISCSIEVAYCSFRLFLRPFLPRFPLFADLRCSFEPTDRFSLSLPFPRALIYSGSGGHGSGGHQYPSRKNFFHGSVREEKSPRRSPRVPADCVCFMFFNICNLSIKL